MVQNKQICSPINDLLRGACAEITMAEHEGGAQLRGDQKESLCYSAAQALSIVNSVPGSRVPKSGNRSQHLNWSKWHQNKAPSAKGAKWLKHTAGEHKWNTLRDNSEAGNRKGGGRELKLDTRENWVVNSFMCCTDDIWCLCLYQVCFALILLPSVMTVWIEPGGAHHLITSEILENR